MSLLENIQTMCKQRNTTVPKLEKELGLGNGSVYKWEKSSPTIDKLQKVADYFGVSTDQLLGKEPSQPPTQIRFRDFPLEPETVNIMCRIPLLSKNNQAIISDMIESMLKNQ